MSEHDPFPPAAPNPAPPVIDHEPARAAAPPPAPPPAPPRVVRRSGGAWFAVLLALLLFGGVEAQNYGYLEQYGIPAPVPHGDSQAVDSLRQQVQAVSQAQSRLEPAVQAASAAAGQLPSLGQQVQALGERLDKLEKAASGQAASGQAAQAAPDLGDLPKRVDDLAARVATLQSQPAPAAPQDNGAAQQAIASLGQKIDEVAAADKAAVDQVAGADKSAIEQAAAAEKSAIDQVQAADGAAIDQAKAADKAALDQAQSQLQAQLEGQIKTQVQAGAETARKQALEEAESAALTQQQAILVQEKTALDALSARIDALQKGASSVEDAATRATRLERVQAAVVALQAGQKLGEIPNAPPALAKFANRAPPTEAALRESFPALAQQARAASQPDTAHKSFLQRTLARLQESVTVRQGDDVLVGDPAAGVLADAEAKVQNGDLAGAVQRLHALHGPAAAVMQPWVEKAASLVDARAALASLAAGG